jgi:hypothetical protein
MAMLLMRIFLKLLEDEEKSKKAVTGSDDQAAEEMLKRKVQAKRPPLLRFAFCLSYLDSFKKH